MKVYVVECGVYSDRYVGGVYATAEAAMRDNPVNITNIPPHHKVRTTGWEQRGDDEWDNGLDMDQAKSISGYEVIQ